MMMAILRQRKLLVVASSQEAGIENRQALTLLAITRTSRIAISNRTEQQAAHS